MLSTILNAIIMALFYLIRPFLGPAECKYGLSCMHFAKKQFKELPTHKALWRIIKRIISCSPWTNARQDLAL